MDEKEVLTRLILCLSLSWEEWTRIGEARRSAGER